MFLLALGGAGVECSIYLCLVCLELNVFECDMKREAHTYAHPPANTHEKTEKERERERTTGKKQTTRPRKKDNIRTALR